MGRGVTPQSFVQIFCGRVKTLVKESGMSNAEVAAALGVEVDTMRRYQNRLLMPHHMVHRFCELMGVKTDFLFREPTVRLEAEVLPRQQKEIPRLTSRKVRA
jgi:hypothetical protein